MGELMSSEKSCHYRVSYRVRDVNGASHDGTVYGYTLPDLRAAAELARRRHAGLRIAFGRVRRVTVEDCGELEV